jgi:hypothetical protein
LLTGYQVAQNVDALNINPNKGFLVGGESSGADLALAVAHLYRDEKELSPLTGLYASINSGVDEETVPEKYKDHFISMFQNANAPILTSETLELVKGKNRMEKNFERTRLRYFRLIQTRTQESIGKTNRVPRPQRDSEDVFPSMRHGSGEGLYLDHGTGLERLWYPDEA